MSRRPTSVLEAPALRRTEVSRGEVEDLLFLEASLLDEWRMEEWLELWTEDAEYIVPTNDNPDADPDRDLMYINHDYRLLKGLVVRLMSVHAHREYPWSKTRHVVTNVRVLGEDEEGVVHADAAFMVWRFRNKDRDCFVGHYELRLRRGDAALRLSRKKITLDAWTLAPYGAISVVL
ncbi:MAG: aromatic-ring-hydroxylating dioxygenase subunit beta [Gaiellaceae bacterium]